MNIILKSGIIIEVSEFDGNQYLKIAQKNPKATISTVGENGETYRYIDIAEVSYIGNDKIAANVQK